MCVYCMMGDSFFRHDKPFDIPEDYPLRRYVPRPIGPPTPRDWPLEKLVEYLELLRKVKEMEDQLGCPCEPNKADYLKLFQERIDYLKRNTPPQAT